MFKLREINLIFGAFNKEHHSNLFIHFMYVLLGGYDPYFCNNFLPLEVFFRLFGFSITKGVEVFNKSNNWKYG